MCKINKIPSEIRKFFSEKRRSTIMEEFTKPFRWNFKLGFLSSCIKHRVSCLITGSPRDRATFFTLSPLRRSTISCDIYMAWAILENSI